MTIENNNETTNEETIEGTAGNEEQEQDKVDNGEEVAESNDRETKEISTVTLTQAEFNEKIQKRLERDRKKYADYDDLKAKAKAHDEALRQAELEKMTEVERLETFLQEKSEELERYKQESEQAMKEAEELRIRTAFEAKARDAGIKYVEDAYRLADAELLANIKVSDAGVDGIDEVIKDIATNKPFLLSPAQPIGKPMAQKELPKKSQEELLKEAAEKARTEGTVEARAAYSRLKRSLGLA